MLPYKIVILVIVTFSYADGQSCRTPSGGLGECLIISDCRSLQGIITKKNKTTEETELLKKSFCGYGITDIPKVCCPINCTTPEGMAGECINIHSCSHLAALLQPPVLENSIQYVKKTKCKSSDRYSVCCKLSTEEVSVHGNCARNNSTLPPDPRTDCCGISLAVDDKLILGPISHIDQFPWVAIIEYEQEGRIKLLCGGALISRKYVLTAAKCVTGGILQYGVPKNIRLGEYNINNDGKDCVPDYAGGLDCTEGAVIVPIESITPHPEYNAMLKRHDIALIRLKQLAPYTDFIRPICLPSSDVTPPSPKSSSQLSFQVSGWDLNNARTSQNENGFLNYQNLTKCQAAYKNTTELWDGQICASSNGAPCKGDIGGPLMYNHARVSEVHGITSFQPTPCNNELPAVYTKVYKYVDWIRSTIKP